MNEGMLNNLYFSAVTIFIVISVMMILKISFKTRETIRNNESHNVREDITFKASDRLNNYDNDRLKKILLKIEDETKKGRTYYIDQKYLPDSTKLENELQSMGYVARLILTNKIYWDFEPLFHDHPMSAYQVRKRHGITFVNKADETVVQNMIKELEQSPDALEIIRTFKEDERQAELVARRLNSLGYEARKDFRVDNIYNGEYVVYIRP